MKDEKKSRSLIDKITHNRQRNTYVSLLKKTKKEFHSNFNAKNIVDNKKI